MEDEEEEEDPDELNVQSEKFNALHALYSNKTVIPFPSAPVLDNVAKATSLLSRNKDLINQPRQSVRVKKEVEPSTSSNVTEGVKNEATPGGEAWISGPKDKRGNENEEGLSADRAIMGHVVSLKGASGSVLDSVAKHLSSAASSRFKSQKNVLTRMEETKGPLAFLKACMEKRIRVKVWTRTAKGIRGHCLGFVAAFDKHWNLVLEDVHEVWTRRTKRKKLLLGQPNEMPLAWKAMGPALRPPKVVVTRGNGNLETCERHVNQMLMRGEQIAFVSVLEA